MVACGIRSGGVVVALALTLAGRAAPATAEDRAAITPAERVFRSIERGLAVVQNGARSYPTHRKCFACHHQTLPLLSLAESRDAGRPIDDTLPGEILKFTESSFRGKIDELNAGDGIGGKGLTVGYGLWTFKLARWKPDDLTEAMVTYLLKIQDADGHWELHSIRPPAEESLVMSTVLAAAGIRSFAADSQREPATAALNKARAWLAAARYETHEDRVARLWGLSLLGGDTDEQIDSARRDLLATQRADGGWSQMPQMESDAYATGTALYVLLDTLPSRFTRGAGRDAGASGIRSGECDAQNAVAGKQAIPRGPAADLIENALTRGRDWLIANQLDDGSWHVQTRAKPVQVYFDNGDPHGKDQFLSIAATGWATAALARGLLVP